MCIYIYTPSGKLTQLWKITIFNGKIHYKWAIFHSYVSLPEGIVITIWKYVPIF